MAASPTVDDMKSPNKLARQIKSQSVKLQYWSLIGSLRILGFPDETYRNDDDGSSQRGQDRVPDRIARAIFKEWNDVWKSN